MSSDFSPGKEIRIIDEGLILVTADPSLPTGPQSSDMLDLLTKALWVGSLCCARISSYSEPEDRKWKIAHTVPLRK